MERRTGGFTLTEIVVVLCICLLIVTGLYYGYIRSTGADCCDWDLALPIGQADLPRVNGGNHYDDDHDGVDFEFDYPEHQLIEVIAPGDGIVTGRWRNTLPNGREQISINIQREVQPDMRLNVFLVFEPDTPNTSDVEYQDTLVIVQVGDVVTKGLPVGSLVVRDPGFVGWYPVLHWSVFIGPDAGYLETAHDCPRNYLTPAAKDELDNLFERLNQELEPTHPSLPLMPVCDREY